MDSVSSWIGENLFLVAGSCGAVLVLLVVVSVVAAMTLRRRASQAGRDNEQAGVPGWQSSTTTIDVVSDEAYPPASTDPNVTTLSPRPAPPSLLSACPVCVPPPPPSFGPPAQAPSPEGPVAGNTVVIPRGPKPKLRGTLVDGNRRHEFEKTITIGRAPGNTIVLDHPTVSRQHATLKLEGAEFRLYDLGSANGTFVGETRLREPISLQDGMTIRFGQIAFTFKQALVERK